MKINKYGPCASCGIIVQGNKGFIGGIQYHCNEPPCYPESLTALDDYFRKTFERTMNDNE